MSIFRTIRLSIRTKVLLLALGLALTPLIIVSLLGLSSLDTARDTAMRSSIDALRAQAEANLAKRAADKAQLYNATLVDIQHQVEGMATMVSATIASRQPPISASGPVWISPNGPSPESEATYAQSAARAPVHPDLGHGGAALQADQPGLCRAR